jgi:hypothetical protein
MIEGLSEFLLGQYRLASDPDNPERVWIFNVDGEGGAFPVAEVERVIAEYFKEKF